MTDPEGTSLVGIIDPLIEQIVDEALHNCGRPLKGKVEVIPYNRRLGRVVVSDKLGNLLKNEYSDGWFDDIVFAQRVATRLNVKRTL